MTDEEFVNGVRYHMDQLLATTNEVRTEGATKAEAVQALADNLDRVGQEDPHPERAILGLATLAALTIVELAYRANE